MPRIFHIAVEVPDVSDGCRKCTFARLGKNESGELVHFCHVHYQEILRDMSTVPEWCTAETFEKSFKDML